MKTQLQLIIVLLVFSFYQSNGQCPTGAVTFSNQSQIDNFIINYPNCQEINGNVDIMGGNITNLNGLSNITSTNGGLFIQINGSLTDISGLSSLETISGDFLFFDNPNVQNLDALSSLTSINGYLQILNNNNLNSVAGLLNVDTTTLTDFIIYGNPQLQICNLPNFCSYLSNPASTHPREVWGNSGNCIDLTTLTNTCSLPCPTGDWTFVSQTDLDNFKLNYSFCENIVLNELRIEWPQMYEPQVSDLSALKNVINVTGFMLIVANNSLINLNGLNSLTNVSGDLHIVAFQNFESLTGLESLVTIGGTFYMTSHPSPYNNDKLQNLQGLNSLSSVGGGFGITQHNALTSLDGLDSLTYVGEYIQLGYTNLTDITALQNIDPDTITNLFINYNPQLSFCHLPNFCEYLSNPADTHPREIYSNASGCESSAAILAECALGIDTPVSENEWLVYKQNGQFEILTQGFELKEIAVYDMLGRKVYQNHITGTAHTLPEIISNGLLVIKITTTENKIMTKKVIN